MSASNKKKLRKEQELEQLTTSFLASRAARELVCTTIPSSANVLQEARKLPHPSISTKHTRQAPTSFTPFQ